eukprot:m.8249 g.8249  ORF g.8249 m.8249 type:complete len:125 (-) comp5338_c0_seq1:249-623(-)
MSSLAEKMAQREEKRQKKKQLAALLGKELDDIATAQKEREAALSGEKTEQKFTLYMTLFEFKSDHEDDLSFGPGEIIRVYDDTDDWFEGENQQGEKGCFPSNFVRKINMPAGATIAVEDPEAAS